MNLRKRILAAAGILAALGGVAFFAAQSRMMPGVIPENALLVRPTLTLWYTDEALEDYLASVALDYMEEYDVRVVPVLTSGLEYLEAVNEASLREENAPDLYLVTNDSLERAYLAGLAAPIGDPAGAVTQERFPQTALDAVTCQGRLVAYPFYFETSALVYNRTYLEQAASESGVSLEELIPETIDDILSFADSYNAPEAVEAVFKWDVSDIFYNYFFAGNYIDVGGPCGDDASSIDIYNPEAVKGLKAYQDLNQFFSIDAEESSYDAVVADFLEGRLVFTVATTDMLSRIARAASEGTFSYEYGAVALPDVDEEIMTRGLSVTNAVAVNGYGEKQELANEFAAWLVTDGTDTMYGRTGRLPAVNGARIEAEGAEGFLEEYAKSVPMPKLMRTANFWVQMEIACQKIWTGENVSDILKSLSEQLMTQVTGTEYVEEEYIEVPEEEETEYIDEGMD